MKKYLTILFVSIALLAFKSPYDEVESVSDMNKYLRVNLYSVSATSGNQLIDATITAYGSMFDDRVGAEDARKQRNLGENFSLTRDGQLLSVEKRGLMRFPDTAYFKMWNMEKGSYKLDIISLNLDADICEALIEDKYLGISRTILLNGKTDFYFDINDDPTSAKEDRFNIFFRHCPATPMLEPNMEVVPLSLPTEPLHSKISSLLDNKCFRNYVLKPEGTDLVSLPFFRQN